MAQESHAFPRAGEAEWRALVAKTLGERSFETLQSRTVEGLLVQPLYAAAEPAKFPCRPFDAERPWIVRTNSAHPDPAKANAELLADLGGGAAAVTLSGVADGDLARILEGVILEAAAVGVDAGFAGPEAADALSAVAKASPQALLDFRLDPLSAFAEAGLSPGPIGAHVIKAAATAARLAQVHPQAQLFLASGRVVPEAGGGAALEVAAAGAAAIAYARALVRAGLPMAGAFARITMGLAADTDHFTTIANLRAARAVWSRIARACGADLQARLDVASSRRMLAASDPWTNMVRLTAAGFGAAVGGADAVTLGTFTDALGLPTAFARRQSRNIQLVLMEEAHVGRASDPAAGSGYVEDLSGQIARAAWALIQEIERQGGLGAALSAGGVAGQVAGAIAARPEPRLVGVNIFAAVNSEPVEVETVHRGAQVVTRLPGPDSACPPLAPIRLAQPFEAAA